MRYIFAIIALLFVAPACAQQTQTFSKYMQGLSQAVTPLSGTEPMIVLQGGLAKQTPSVNITSTVATIVYAAAYGVSSSNSDNTTAMQAALTAATANGARLIQLPPGILKFCSQTQWGSQNLSGVVIAGAGNGSSAYQPTISGQGTVIQACSTFTGNIQVVFGAAASGQMQHGGGLRDLVFDGNNSAPYGIFAKDVNSAVFENITFYKHFGGAAIGLTNSTNSGSQPPTGENLFKNIRIQERNETSLLTAGITCQGVTSGGAEGVTQNTWINIFIDHANGNGIVVGEVCDQQYWTNLFTFRANTETGNAIVTTGDASSIIGNWTFNGVLTSSTWDIACCSAPNISWNVIGLNTGNWNSGVDEFNFITAGAAGISIMDMGGNFVNSGVRNKLRANTGYFVNTAGSDSNDCLSLATACLTIQHAVNLIELLDFNGFTATVTIGSASASQTFTETVTVSGLVGGGILKFIGANATPTNTVWTSNTDSTLKAVQSGETEVHIGNLEISNTLNGNGSIDCEYNSKIVIENNLVYGTANFAQLYNHDNQCIILEDNATVTIAGNASLHLYTKGGYIFEESSNITINAGVTIQTFAQASTGGVIQSTGTTFTNNGTVTVKFDVDSGGAINTLGSGLNYFPGTFAGNFSSNGTYVDQIASQTGIAINNGFSATQYVSGVSCSAGTVSTATLTIISGVVTHC